MSEDEQPQKGLEQSLASLRDATLTCVICHKLFYQPVTTPCGHTFCKECLFRATDFTRACPYCRTPLRLADAPGASVPNLLRVNTVLRDVLCTLFANEYRARHEEETAYVSQTILKLTADDTNDTDTTHPHHPLTHTPQPQPHTFGIPIFPLAAVVFPGQSFPMHIFEPRYRLMLRRALQSDRRFGIVQCAPDGTLAPIGCIVRVCDATLLPDGRSVIETVGTRRFRIVRTAMMDGYHVARVRFVDDDPDQPDPAQPPPSPPTSPTTPPLAPLDQELRALLARLRDAADAEGGRVSDALRRACAWAADDGRAVGREVVEERLESLGRGGADAAGGDADLGRPAGRSQLSTSYLTLLAAGFLVSDDRQRQELLQSQSARHRLQVILPRLRALSQTIRIPSAPAEGAEDRVASLAPRGGCVVQ